MQMKAFMNNFQDDLQDDLITPYNRFKSQKILTQQT